MKKLKLILLSGNRFDDEKTNPAQKKSPAVTVKSSIISIFKSHFFNCNFQTQTELNKQILEYHELSQNILMYLL